MISTLANLPTNTGLRIDPPPIGPSPTPPTNPAPWPGQRHKWQPSRTPPKNRAPRPDAPPSGPPRTPPSVPPSKPGPWSGPLLPDYPSRDQNTKPPGMPGPLPDFQSRDQNTKPTDSSSISVPPNANGTLNPGDREFGPQNKVLGVQDTSYVTPSKITF